jgi:hypothetical protein
MCLGADYWARIAKTHYACKRGDAASAGFIDDHNDSELSLPPAKHRLPTVQMHREEALPAFEEWRYSAEKTPYGSLAAERPDRKGSLQGGAPQRRAPRRSHLASLRRPSAGRGCKGWRQRRLLAARRLAAVSARRAAPSTSRRAAVRPLLCLRLSTLG